MATQARGNGAVSALAEMLSGAGNPFRTAAGLAPNLIVRLR
jgi:hypothetical protein